jgi:hypothetical protein
MRKPWLVRTAGLEPAPPFGEQILSLLRIPFRHVRFLVAEVTFTLCRSQFSAKRAVRVDSTAPDPRLAERAR